jgi:hypothetical protein
MAAGPSQRSPSSTAFRSLGPFWTLTLAQSHTQAAAVVDEFDAF